MKKLACIVVVVAGLMILVTNFSGDFATAASNESIRLNYASPYSSTHTHALADKAWIDKIEKETNGRVKIKAYFGGTLISRRETVRELAKGAADIAHILPFYSKAGVDLIRGQMSFFQGAPNPRVVMEIAEKVWDEFPEIRKELESVKVLTMGSGTPYYLLTVKKPIQKLEDMKGLRIKGGPEHIAPLKKVGAAAELAPMGEVYISLQKGILDGAFCAYETLKTMRLAEVGKYFNLFPATRGAYPSKAFNLDSWKKLPPDIQKIFEDNGSWHGLTLIEGFLKDDEEGLAFAKEQRVEIIEPPKVERDQWVEIMNESALATAKDLDSKGLPGTKMYNRIQQLIKESKK